MKINVNDMTIDELLQVSHKLHFEICELTSALRKQNEGHGMKLKSLRQFRTLTIKVNRMDLQMRTLTKKIGNEIHEAQAKKWAERKK